MKNLKGFTLIELLVVISIIGVIASIVLVSFSGSRDKAKLAKSQQFSAQTNHALGAYAVGIWDFEDQNDPTIDRSGFGNDGTLYGNTHFVANDVLGGHALSFDGSGDYVDCGNNPSLEIQNSTVEFWINYSTTVGVWNKILGKHAPGSDRSPGIWANPGKTCLHWRYNPGNAGASCLGPNGNNTEFNLGQWYHIVGVKSGTILKIFINGEQKGSDYSVPNPITQGSGHLYLGNNGISFNGTIDDVRIYNEALSVGQIQQHYAQGVAMHGIVLR